MYITRHSAHPQDEHSSYHLHAISRVSARQKYTQQVPYNTTTYHTTTSIKYIPKHSPSLSAYLFYADRLLNEDLLAKNLVGGPYLKTTPNENKNKTWRYSAVSDYNNQCPFVAKHIQNNLTKKTSIDSSAAQLNAPQRNKGKCSKIQKGFTTVSRPGETGEGVYLVASAQEFIAGPKETIQKRNTTTTNTTTNSWKSWVDESLDRFLTPFHFSGTKKNLGNWCGITFSYTTLESQERVFYNGKKWAPENKNSKKWNEARTVIHQYKKNTSIYTYVHTQKKKRTRDYKWMSESTTTHVPVFL